MKTITSILALGIAMLTGASPAFADEPAGAQTQTQVKVNHVQTEQITPPHAAPFATSHAAVSVDLWPSRHNFATVFGAELQLQVARKLFIDLSYAGAFAHVGDAIDAGDNVGFGNPTLGMHVADSPSRNFSYMLGASVTAPLLQDPSVDVSNAAFYGQRIRGFYDADRFVRGHMAARVAAGFQLQGMGPLLLRGEVRPVLYIPTNDKHEAFPESRVGLPGSGKGKTELTIESAVEIEARSSGGLGAGLRLQGVVMPTLEDKLQTVVEPFLQITPPGPGIFARVGFPLALDEGLGFGLNEDKLAGMKLCLGGQW